MKARSLPMSAMGFALALCACDHEAELALSPSVATFSLETVSFSENDGGQDIAIELSKPAHDAGSLTVSVVSDALDHFSFIPEAQGGVIKLEVPKGSSRVVFTVQPIDNQVTDGTKLVSLTLRDASRGLQIGSRKQMQSTWLDDEGPSRITFALERSDLNESSITGSEVTLALSHAAPGDGSIEIEFTNSGALYGKDFVTIPAAVNNVVTIPVSAGATVASFMVHPVNDVLFNAGRNIQFRIKGVSSGLEKGSQLAHEFSITDDELSGMAKSYITNAGSGWSSKRQLHYALNGHIERVIWENKTPGETAGEYRYFYNETGGIEKVVTGTTSYVRYLRENGRIVKKETYDNDELDAYTIYGYDPMGNVGEMAQYDRQADGSFAFSLDFIFLYYTDGNLYKKLVYNPVEGGEPVLLTTDTYEGYVDGVNPFPIELIHGQPIQHKLPTVYRHDTGEKVLAYSLSYEFMEGGRPLSRTTYGPSGRESTTYEYY